MTREELQIPRTPREMRDLISSFEHDRATYPDNIVHNRQGVVKDLVEEYAPLLTLVENLEDVETARLNPQYAPIDAVVRLSSGRELSIQITLANDSYQTALHREILMEDGSATVGSVKCRDKETGKAVDHGRGLRTREGRLREQVTEVMKAIECKAKKEEKRKAKGALPKTDVLLVWTEITLDDSEIAYSWREDLTARFKIFGSILYETVYVANGMNLLKIKP